MVMSLLVQLTVHCSAEDQLFGEDVAVHGFVPGRADRYPSADKPCTRRPEAKHSRCGTDSNKVAVWG